MGLASVGTALMLGGSPVKAFGRTPLLAPLLGLEGERVLVLVQLEGGNDGLNTIVPIRNDRYYSRRPTLALQPGQTLSLTDELGLHPALTDVQALYGDGHAAIVQGVGYDNPDLSHFRSTDIWVSASDADVYDRTGWSGRYLESLYPDFADNPPAQPVGVQLGGASLMFQGPANNMGMALESPEAFERLAEDGTRYDVQTVPSTTYGAEMAYARTVANNSFRYAEALQVAAEAGQNSVEYPAYDLAMRLAIVARLIKGNLGARIYLVSMGGFDTHSDQDGVHAYLLEALSASVKAFMADLDAGSRTQDVLTMTFSEFGRTIQENGSRGTDHATAAPLFLFGPALQGGLYGEPPDLRTLNENGDMRHAVDFRSVYATVLQDWFGVDEAATQAVLGGRFDTLPFLRGATGTAAETPSVPGAFSLQANYPNPFNDRTVIGYALERTEAVRLRVYDVQGRVVATLVDRTQAPGRYRVGFAPGRLPSGTYFYRLETAAGVRTRTMTLLR